MKTASADGTWGETPWESRSPPGFLETPPPRERSQRRGRRRVPVITHTARYARKHARHDRDQHRHGQTNDAARSLQGRPPAKRRGGPAHRSAERGRPWRRPRARRDRRRRAQRQRRATGHRAGSDPAASVAAPADVRRAADHASAPDRARRRAGSARTASTGATRRPGERRNSPTRGRRRPRRRAIGPRSRGPSASRADARQPTRAESRRAQPSAPHPPAAQARSGRRAAGDRPGSRGRNANRALRHAHGRRRRVRPRPRARGAAHPAPAARRSCPTRRASASSSASRQYRIGNYAAAAKELEAYAELTDSVDQHPVLMDCYRAQRRWRKVEELWEELAAVSPSAELVTEGRIVYAGALADQGRLPEALALLAQAGRTRSRPRRSTTCGSGTRSPTSRSGPATSPGPASCSTGCDAPTRVRRRRRAPRRARMSVTAPP